MKQLTDEQVIKEAIASTLTAEEKALGAFLGAMHDCKLDGAKMREAMIGVLGLTGEAQPTADDKDGPFAKFKKAGWAKECQDTDNLLECLGLDPALCRADGGWLNIPRIKAIIESKAGRDWSLLEATQESLREHMALVKELREKPADDKAGGEVVAWLYTLFGRSGEICNIEASTVNWDERYKPFGRPGIDFHEDGIVRKEPLYTRPQPQAEQKQPEFFTGVDVADGTVSVSVMRRRPDDVAELVHLEQTPITIQQQAIPAGYALVPVEPTPEMNRAAVEDGSSDTEYLAEMTYLAMLAAAPKVK